MTGLATDRVTDQTGNKSADSLVLDSDLAAMTRLAQWIDSLAVRHGLPEKILFAARLCLEESVSNSIRHGYRGLSGSQVRISLKGLTEHGWIFTVEDDAPRFNPLEQAELPAISPDSVGVGGQGIRLMKAFASSLAYEETPTGNRLRISFAPAPSM